MSNARCRMCVTASGGAGCGPARPTCRPPRCVWCREVAGRRQHRSLEGAAPAVVFAAVEADALRPLPLSRFELARWSTPKVGPDCHIKVGKALYSVPWRLIGRRVDAREGDRIVEVFVDGSRGQDPSPGRTGPPDRLQRLPAGEGGVLHAHPGVVPSPSRRARPRTWPS